MGQHNVANSEPRVEAIELREWGLVGVSELLQFIATHGPIAQVERVQDVADDWKRPHDRALAIALSTRRMSKRAILQRLQEQTQRVFRVHKPFSDAISIGYES